jgi:hypothetical protein
MTDKEFLNWLANRLVLHYGENENVDLVLRLKEIANRYDTYDNGNRVQQAWRHPN